MNLIIDNEFINFPNCRVLWWSYYLKLTEYSLKAVYNGGGIKYQTLICIVIFKQGFFYSVRPSTFSCSYSVPLAYNYLFTISARLTVLGISKSYPIISTVFISTSTLVTSITKIPNFLFLVFTTLISWGTSFPEDAVGMMGILPYLISIWANFCSFASSLLGFDSFYSSFSLAFNFFFSFLPNFSLLFIFLLLTNKHLSVGVEVWRWR